MIPETLKPGAHRVHSSYVWLGSLPISLSLIVASLPGLAQVLTLVLIVPLMALIAVLVLGLRVLGWTRLSYELSETEFRKSWGVVFKRKTHVPYQRIQSVNQSARPLQRVVGVCDVRIETAGGSSNEAVVLQCMRVSEVEALRGELFRRKKVLLDGGSLDAWGSATVDGVVYPSQWACIQYGIDPSQARPVRVDGTPVDVASSTRASAPSAPSGGISVAGGAQPGAEANLLGGVAAASDRFRGLDGGEAVETGPVSYETGLSNVELLLAGLTGIGSSVGVVLAALFGALGYLPSVVNDRLRAYFEEMAGSSLDPALSLQAGDMASFSANGLVGAIAIALLVLFILLVFSALGSMLTYGSFRLRRRGSRIEIESGLVSRAFHGIDVDRVQSIVIDQSFFRRLIGYCEIRVEKIDTLDPSQKQAGQAAHGTILHPFIKLSRVPSLLEGILPEFGPRGSAPRHHEDCRLAELRSLRGDRHGRFACGFVRLGSAGRFRPGSRRPDFHRARHHRDPARLLPDRRRALHRARRALVQGFGPRIRPPIHDARERRVLAAHIRRPSSEDPVRHAFRESFPARLEGSLRIGAHGRRHRRQDDDALGSLAFGCERLAGMGASARLTALC